MRLTTKRKQIVILALLLVMFSIALIQGCGDSNTQCTAPFGSTIVINPSSQSLAVPGGIVPGNTPFNFQVLVLYPDNTIMPKACITISGSQAAPVTPSSYQFFFNPNGTTNSTGNVAVNSGFEAQTDDFGQYTFSAEVSAGTGTFQDTIVVSSGAVQGTATLSIAAN